MATQLPLLDPAETDSLWRLDDHTRELGRRGVEQARRALADAAARSTRAA